MPKGGDWTPLKNNATNFVREGGQGSISPGRLLGGYLQANGGAQALSRGTGGGGKRGSSRHGIGSSARTTITKLGGFLSGVASKGLDNTLRDFGLDDLIGKTATEVCSGLLQEFTSEAKTLDEFATRAAFDNILTDLFEKDEQYEDIEDSINQALDEKGLLQIMGEFFGHYLYELFCRDFYEDWQKKVGANQAKNSLKQVKDCIFSEVRSKLVDKSYNTSDWTGKEGQELADQIMQDTLNIFGVLS